MLRPGNTARAPLGNFPTQEGDGWGFFVGLLVTGLPAPVVASAWDAQLVLEDPEDPALVDFLREFDRGVTTPEHGGPCSGSYGGTEAEFEDDRAELESLVERLG